MHRLTVAATRRVSKIDDQAASSTKTLKGAVERRDGGAVSKGIVESYVADSATDLRDVKRCSLGCGPIASGKFYRASLPAFANLEAPC